MILASNTKWFSTTRYFWIHVFALRTKLKYQPCFSMLWLRQKSITHRTKPANFWALQVFLSQFLSDFKCLQDHTVWSRISFTKSTNVWFSTFMLNSSDLYNLRKWSFRIIFHLESHSTVIPLLCLRGFHILLAVPVLPSHYPHFLH